MQRKLEPNRASAFCGYELCASRDMAIIMTMRCMNILIHGIHFLGSEAARHISNATPGHSYEEDNTE